MEKLLLKKIRQEFKDKDTTIIMATGESDKYKMNDCIILGISAYIVKPFVLREINEIVRQAHKGEKFYLKL